MKSFTVKRLGALGDVLCVGPVLDRLRKENPDAAITLQTQSPQALQGHRALRSAAPLGRADEHRLIELDLAYEKRPSMHVVDAYFEEAFGDLGDPQDKTLYLKPTAPWHNDGVAVIHAARSWPSRTFSYSFWDEVARLVKEEYGLLPVFVGANADYSGPLWATSTINRLLLPQVGALIAGASVFIGSDSSLIHVASTTETPIVGLYTSVRAKYRMPYRHGVLGWNMVGLEADVSCVGCLEKLPAPLTNLVCGRGDNLCVRSIVPVAVSVAVGGLLSAGAASAAASGIPA